MPLGNYATSIGTGAAVGSAFGPVGTFAGGIIGGIGQGVWDIFNYFNNQNRMDQAWSRDDDAIRRRVQDMIRAGINPVMAAGNGASNTAPIQLRSPDITGMGQSIDDYIIKSLTLMRGKQDIATSHAQELHNLAQVEKTQTESQFLKDSMSDRLNLLYQESRMKAQNLEQSYKLAVQKYDTQELNQAFIKAQTDLARDKSLNLAVLDVKLGSDIVVNGTKVPLNLAMAGYFDASTEDKKRILTRLMTMKDLYNQGVLNSLRGRGAGYPEGGPSTSTQGLINVQPNINVQPKINLFSND